MTTKMSLEVLLLEIIIAMNVLARTFNVITGSELVYKIILLGGGLLLFICNSTKIKRMYWQYIVIISFSLLLTIWKGFDSITLCLRLFAELGIAVSLVKNDTDNAFKAFARNVCIIPLVYYAVWALSGRSVYEFAMTQTNDSKNHIAITAMFCIVFLFALDGVVPNQFSTIHAFSVLSFLIINFWVQSRGGILIFLLIGSIYLSTVFLQLSTRQKVALVCISSIIICLVSFQYGGDVLAFWKSFTLVYTEKGMTDSIRLEIWKNYFDTLNLKGLLCGGESIVSVRNYSLTLHNSFLLMHSRMGIMCIPALAAFGVTIKNGLRFRPARTEVLLFITLMVRACTDTILFSFFDFVFLYILFKIYEMCKLSELK